MAKKRKYFNRAYAAKCYQGPKSVNLVLDSAAALLVSGGLLEAVNSGVTKIDLAVYPARKAGAKILVTVTSRSNKSDLAAVAGEGARATQARATQARATQARATQDGAKNGEREI